MNKKQIAINIAKIAKHEASETLKSVRTQVGLEIAKDKTQEQKLSEAKSASGGQPEINKAKIHNQSIRQIQALEKELEDIQRQKLQKKQEELQQEQIRRQEEVQRKQSKAPAPTESKKGRRVAGAMKKVKATFNNLFKQQRNVEMRQPPSS